MLAMASALRPPVIFQSAVWLDSVSLVFLNGVQTVYDHQSACFLGLLPA